MERKMHLETILAVKRFIDQKDYEGLKKYINTREIEISLVKTDIAGNYIDKLISELQ